MAKLVSKVYAKAFFDLALDLNKIDIYEEQANFVLDSLKLDDNFLKILNHPKVDDSKKLSLFLEIFKDKIDEDFFGLFNVIICKKREEYIVDILNNFIDIIRDYKGLVVAEVFSPIDLTSDQLLKIKNNLSSKFDKEIRINFSIDKSLIAGLKIIVDGHIIDGTVKKQINDIKSTLYNIKMA